MAFVRIKTTGYKTVAEMTREEYREYRRGWYRHELRCLLKSGHSREDAKALAKEKFLAEKALGFPLRERVILSNRIRRNKRRVKYVESHDDLPRVYVRR